MQLKPGFILPGFIQVTSYHLSDLAWTLMPSHQAVCISLDLFSRTWEVLGSGVPRVFAQCPQAVPVTGSRVWPFLVLGEVTSSGVDTTCFPVSLLTNEGGHL